MSAVLKLTYFRHFPAFQLLSAVSSCKFQCCSGVTTSLITLFLSSGISPKLVDLRSDLMLCTAVLKPGWPCFKLAFRKSDKCWDLSIVRRSRSAWRWQFVVIQTNNRLLLGRQRTSKERFTGRCCVTVSVSYGRSPEESKVQEFWDKGLVCGGTDELWTVDQKLMRL